YQERVTGAPVLEHGRVGRPGLHDLQPLLRALTRWWVNPVGLAAGGPGGGAVRLPAGRPVGGAVRLPAGGPLGDFGDLPRRGGGGARRRRPAPPGGFWPPPPP